MTVRELERRAAIARGLVVEMVSKGGSGHLGGALSAIDVITALHFHVLRERPEEPDWPYRDRFVLSAGHKGMALYAVLALRGYFPLDVLQSYGSARTVLPGHPNMHSLPGVEANTGALGHGLALAAGMAIGARVHSNQARVFTLLGDGELAEGSNWEAFAAAAHHRLENLTAIIDCNGLQISGPTAGIMSMEPIPQKLRAFGWQVTEIDGNDMAQVIGALGDTRAGEGRPHAIVARTVKGKGISFAEGAVAYHYWKPQEGELDLARSEISARVRQLEEAGA